MAATLVCGALCVLDEEPEDRVYAVFFFLGAIGAIAMLPLCWMKRVS